MKTTVEYLDAVKARRDLPSDYAAAKLLGVTRAAVSRYRLGQGYFEDIVALRVAEILEIDPMEVIAAVNIERARTESDRRTWTVFLEKISKGFRTLVLPANARGALFSAA